MITNAANALNLKTLIAYRLDKRCKRGQKQVESYDVPEGGTVENDANLRLFKDRYENHKHLIREVNTYREVTNLASRQKVLERYDLPDCCSVGSETYWTM
jgi:hypothetical protein